MVLFSNLDLVYKQIGIQYSEGSVVSSDVGILVTFIILLIILVLFCFFFLLFVFRLGPCRGSPCSADLLRCRCLLVDLLGDHSRGRGCRRHGLLDDTRLLHCNLRWHR